MSQDKEAEIRAKFPYHGETFNCIAIVAIPRGLMLEFAFTIDTRNISGERENFNAKLDTMVIKGFEETIDLFIQSGLSVDKKDRYLNCDLQRRPIAVVLNYVEQYNGYRIVAVKNAGKTVKLEDLPKKAERKAPEVPIMHNGKLTRPSEIPSPVAIVEETKSVGTDYAMPDTLEAQIAMMQKLSASIYEQLKTQDSDNRKLIAAQMVAHANYLAGNNDYLATRKTKF